MSHMFRTPLSAVLLILLSTGAFAAGCPRPDGNGHVIFPDGAILMKTGLEVNPDGAAASYTPGDHGYTYLNNGVNLIENGTKVSCSGGGNGARCKEKWARAEAGAFGAGTPEFCVFAMEVEPIQPGGQLTGCEKRGRFVVGNGKGRPKAGASVPKVGGGSSATYSSTTTLQHTRNGEAVYVDSGSIAGLVVPQSRSSLVGAVAWVRYGGSSGFAIVNDTGPAFGEGSVALHQLLRNGRIGPVQPIGPIAVNLRCSAAESDMQPPFVSRPDQGQTDKCRPGYAARGPADIRAYSGIAGDVVSIILPTVKPPMQGRRVTEELTADRMQALASAAGFSQEKLQQMASCIRP